MFERSSIRRQFIYNFMVIIICSIIAFIITFFIGMVIIENVESLHPANYYEKKIPDIENYIQAQGEDILNEDNRERLEKVIPTEGIKYRVVGNKYRVVGNNGVNYGTLEKDYNYSMNEMLLKINTQEVAIDNYITRYTPIISKEGELKGVVLLQYKVAISSTDGDSKGLLLAQIFIGISPFFYIILFTFIFGSKFAKRIKEPLNIIEEATEKIKNNDLDFKVEYKYDNELGNVIKSVETMRSELEKSLKNQWISESEKRDIIAALSHDLRTPLTVIKGNVEILLDGAYKKEERLLKYLDGIERATKKSVKLVADLNNLSKLESKEIDIKLETVNLNKFIYKELQQYEVMLEKKSITLEKRIDKDIENKEINIDPLRISQVIDNIISNAYRYTKENGKVTFELSKINDKTKFVISNSGNGFSNEELKYATSKFYRGDKSRSTKNSNLGLGLYICKDIIEKHNGTFKIYNNHDNEATVEFII